MNMGIEFVKGSLLIDNTFYRAISWSDLRIACSDINMNKLLAGLDLKGHIIPAFIADLKVTEGTVFISEWSRELAEGYGKIFAKLKDEDVI